MSRFLKCFPALLYLFVVVSCFKETPVQVAADFEMEVADHDYSVPVTIRLVNKSVGADLYEWTFEGGSPAASKKANPEEVVYQRAGKYTVRLRAWNTTGEGVKELTVDVDSALYAGFVYQVVLNRFSPVELTLTNCSFGGSRYYWEFSGGQPEVYEGKNPPPVIFTGAGWHPVSLKVFNSGEVMEFTDTIRVLPPLAVDFDWQPGQGDEDLEAPFVARLSACCTSALSYRWHVEGGRIENDTLADTRVYLDEPGVYRVVLTATNGKETKSISKEIKVSENSNLYVLSDLKFGIITALNKVGGYYSSATRSVLTIRELTPENGPTVDLVFWGLAGFDACCFVSPDSVGGKALPDIPGAGHTWVVNRPTGVSTEQFEVMKDDSWLKEVEVRENSDRERNVYFTSGDVPHLVVFETGDGRKGIIRIKEYVGAGKESYIRADLKIQKN